ncbi:site-specific integrase [Mucilaginibacter paludis]|uniref:Integrase family protein n=1 Tax=Mucilaginibacter paludis DSM 18603 TaxID=714943 RepID=H1Y5R0_9SPHI|nr:site-specific integrase [Mucilaginibacter paludis]EHQ29836.1 integrase family protein [Mucilaginibacter paludis DSM 18603]
MATAKIVTWSRADKNAQFPIGIKVSQNGIPAYLFEGNALASRDLWDATKQQVKKSHPHHMRLTNFLIKRLAEINEKILEFETDRKRYSAEDVVNAIKPKPIQEPPPAPKPPLFKDVADNYLQEQKGLGNYDVWKSDRSKLKRFYEFAGEDVTFPKITVEYLRRYTLFLRTGRNLNRKEGHTPLSDRTVTNHLLVIRTMYNRAKTAGLVGNKTYPFGGKEKIIIKFGKTEKIGLNGDEINQLKQYQFSAQHTHLHDSRNIWLVCFYFAGMRITDALLLKWSDFQNGRFYYTMSKNGEPGSLPIPPVVSAIIEEYKTAGHAHDLVFPFLKNLDGLDNRYMVRRRINSVTRLIGEHMGLIMGLLKINKNASPHKARHAFAQRAEEKEIHPKVLQKMYRHESITTTMQYQSNFSHKKADEALEAVIDF